MNKRKSTSRKSKSYKEGNILALSAVIVTVVLFSYYWLFEILTMRIHAPYYFASTKATIVYFLLFLVFVVIIISIGVLLKKKTVSKKHICYAFIVPMIVVAIMIILSGNVWIVNENSISYNTLFQKNKIVYYYNDIESAEMSISYQRVRLNHTYRIKYDLYMNDGEKVEFDVYESFRDDDNRLIEFDKAIADKRKVTGEFIYMDHSSEEFNKYYQSLFTNT